MTETEVVTTFEVGDVVRFRRQAWDSGKVAFILGLIESGNFGSGTYIVSEAKWLDAVTKGGVGHAQSLRLVHVATEAPFDGGHGSWSGWWFEKV